MDWVTRGAWLKNLWRTISSAPSKKRVTSFAGRSIRRFASVLKNVACTSWTASVVAVNVASPEGGMPGRMIGTCAAGGAPPATTASAASVTGTAGARPCDPRPAPARDADPGVLGR